MQNLKSLTIGVAAVAAIGGVAAGLTATVSPASYQVQPVVFGAPLPQDPAPVPAPVILVPTTAELTGILNTLADPAVSFEEKGYLVEGGIEGIEAHVADHELNEAADNGQLPLSFDITDVQPTTDGGATADVAVSGPRISPPVVQTLTFVNQDGWAVSRDSAMELLRAASSG
ncbi:hypothetical protein [Mycobacterium sp.]|uniref:hypothetical protein n=1 Tax=Mycobacterium sp. TaxID=1785 RepID=UPI003A8A7B85